MVVVVVVLHYDLKECILYVFERHFYESFSIIIQQLSIKKRILWEVVIYILYKIAETLQSIFYSQSLLLLCHVSHLFSISYLIYSWLLFFLTLWLLLFQLFNSIFGSSPNYSTPYRCNFSNPFSLSSFLCHLMGIFIPSLPLHFLAILFSIIPHLTVAISSHHSSPFLTLLLPIFLALLKWKLLSVKIPLMASRMFNGRHIMNCDPRLGHHFLNNNNNNDDDEGGESQL